MIETEGKRPPPALDHRELGIRGELGVGEVGGCDDGAGVVLEGAVDAGGADCHYDYCANVGGDAHRRMERDERGEGKEARGRTCRCLKH